MRFRAISPVLRDRPAQLLSVEVHACRHFIGDTYIKVNRSRLYISQVTSIAMSYNKKQFTERLREICLDSGLPEKQWQSALVTVTKKKQPSVSDWLNGHTMPDEENLLKIIRWGKTTSDYLLYAIGPKHPGEKVTAIYTKDDFEKQLLEVYRSLASEEDREWLLAQANFIYNKAHPGKGVGNPFDKRVTDISTKRRDESEKVIDIKRKVKPKRRQS